MVCDVELYSVGTSHGRFYPLNPSYIVQEQAFGVQSGNESRAPISIFMIQTETSLTRNPGMLFGVVIKMYREVIYIGAAVSCMQHFILIMDKARGVLIYNRLSGLRTL